MELSGKQRKPSVYGGWLGFAGPTLYKYMRAPGLLTDTYPDVVAAKASVGLRIELGSLQYLRKTSPGEIQTTCDAIELEARQEIVFLLKDIIAHHKGKKR